MKVMPLTDLQKFLREELDSSDALESHRTVAQDSYSVLCCFRRCVCTLALI